MKNSERKNVSAFWAVNKEKKVRIVVALYSHQTRGTQCARDTQRLLCYKQAWVMCMLLNWKKTVSVVMATVQTLKCAKEQREYSFRKGKISSK